MSRGWIFGRDRLARDGEAASVAQADSGDHISNLEEELRVAVAQEAETARQFASDRNRRAALDEQLHKTRRQRLDEASQARDALLAEAEELLQASRIEAEHEAAQITGRAIDEARKIVAIAEAEAAQRMDGLDTEHRALTHRLGVMETIYDELQETLKLVAEAAIEELGATRNSLNHPNRPPTEPNSEPTASGSGSQDELLDSTPATVGPILQVDEAGSEASGEENQTEAPSESVPRFDDDGTEEAAIIIVDRDPEHRRSRYGRRLILNREDHASNKNRARRDEATSSNPFNRVLSIGDGIESANPEEVEARLRNMSHGTNSE